jgi:hypothetical protein
VRNLSPWPQTLVDRFDDNRPFRGFSSAFRWLANVPRTDRPNGKVALSYWMDVCRGWLRARNSVASDLDANALILAVLASGDVAYCPANHQLGAVWELGLVEFGGRPASPDGWKRILREGASGPAAFVTGAEVADGGAGEDLRRLNLWNCSRAASLAPLSPAL